MPRKKKKDARRGQGREEDFEDVDVMSVRSEDEENESVDSKLDEARDALEEMTSKRGSTRVGALKKLNKLLRNSYMYDFVQDREDTFATYLASVIRKGANSNEVRLGCDTLQLVAITLGAECEGCFESLRPILETLIKNPAKPTESRCAAVSALSMLCFLGCTDESVQVSTVELIRAATKGFDKARTDEEKTNLAAELTATSLGAWSFLATTVYREGQLGTEIFDGFSEDLSNFLGHPDLEVRTAAGECIALMYNAYLNVEEQLTDYDLEVDLDSLIDQLTDLSTDASKRKNKKDKASQRRSFREILKTVEEGEIPSEQLKIGKNKFEFEGWAMLRQLSAFRATLQQGMLVHFTCNELLADIFQLDIELEEETGQSGIHMKKSQQKAFQRKAKESFQSRDRNRTKKNSQRSAFMDD